MPWKAGYTISDTRTLTDAEVHWPESARCCVNLVVDLSPLCRPEGIRPADLQTPEAYYATNGALTAVLATLDRFALRATFAVPAVIAAIHPDKVRALHAAGHEVAAHGFRHEDVSALSRDEEKARLDRTTEIIADVVGERPAGWYSLPRQGDKFAGGSVSKHTMDLLIEAGYLYMGNGLADDIPHWWVTDFDSRSAMLALPYYYHFDDQFFLSFPEKGTGLDHPDVLFRNWKAEFEAQYKRGRYFGMTLHPHAIAWPNHLQMLEDFLTHMAAFPQLWNATGRQCATHWRENFPAETHLRLEPSIWQDHPGSLS